MVLTSKKQNFNIEETKLYKSLKKLQKEIQSRSDSEWFDWIYSRMEFDKEFGVLGEYYYDGILNMYYDIANISFVVNNLESSISLVLKRNDTTLNDNSRTSMLTKMDGRECIPSIDSDTIFSKGFVFYNINGYYVLPIKETCYVSKDGKEKKMKKAFQISNFGEIQNPKLECSNSLRDIAYNKDTFRISETIFPDKLFDDFFINLSSDLEINLSPNFYYLEKVDTSILKFKNITTFEKLCWLSCELKSGFLSKDCSNKYELLTKFNFEVNYLLNNNIHKDKISKDISGYFFEFLLKNYCNIAHFNSYGKQVALKFFSETLREHSNLCGGIFRVEELPEAQNIKDPISLIEQKQIFLNHLKLYESEFASVLNKYHLKFLKWMIKEYEIGTIPAISIYITLKDTGVSKYISGVFYKLVRKLPAITWLLKSNGRFLYIYINELNNIFFNTGRPAAGIISGLASNRLYK